MSVIRPYAPLAAPVPSARATVPAAAAREAQRAFFQAALGGSAPMPATTPVARSVTTPVEEPARPLRPGSLLDIRI